MNIMFNGPAVIATSIVACRSFVSLSTFRQKGVHIHSAPRYSSSASEGSRGGGAIRAREDGGVTNGGRRAKEQRVMGNATAGFTLRSMAEGIDSMGQLYSMDVLDLKRTSSMLGGADSSRGPGGNGQVVVYVERTVHDHVDLESCVPDMGGRALCLNLPSN